MSIRLRLSLLFTAILATTLIAFSIGLFLTLGRTTHDLIKDRLIDESKQLIANQEFRLDRIVIRPAKLGLSETLIQTRSLDGEIVDRSDELEKMSLSLPLSDDELESVQGGMYSVEQTTLGDVRLLVYTARVKIHGQSVGILQVARSLDAQAQALQTLQRLLLVGTSVAVVIAFGAGWLLAGIALRPINRITQTAKAIGAQRDFGQRVENRGPADEVGQLATTFNQMLAELQAAYRQEEQALQAQRRFVADASHELRTPLTTIRGNIALLQRDPPIAPDDREAALADMADEGERMSRLVNSLLTLARADAGRQLRQEPVALKPLVEDACRKVRPLDTGHVLDCNRVDDDMVMGDPDALTQVLLILLDNALKWTPATGTITVRASRQNSAVALAVQDTGAGIAPEALPHIFDRFYRGDATRTGGGAGLGLSIARTLVEAQQGTIEVRSAVGVGSTFTVILPAAEQQGLDVFEDLNTESASSV
jgi:two-component system OmpR family sensor kinase